MAIKKKKLPTVKTGFIGQRVSEEAELRLKILCEVLNYKRGERLEQGSLLEELINNEYEEAKRKHGAEVSKARIKL